MPAYEPLVREVQAAEGEAREEAFGALIAQFQSMAQSWAYRELGDAHLAQDVTQEAFLSAYQKIDQLRDPAAFPGWLKRIVLTHSRRATRRQSPALLPFEDEDAPQQADPAASAEHRELAEQVTRAVRSLPEHERVVTELFYIGDYSQQEIAERLALPLTTVKKRLQYAREHLRETITLPPMSVLYESSAEITADTQLLRLLSMIFPEMFALA